MTPFHHLTARAPLAPVRHQHCLAGHPDFRALPRPHLRGRHPHHEGNIIDRKREMIRELTQATWSELADSRPASARALLSRQDAQAAAVARIQSLRYGDDGKDYFWISDLHPRMIVHPYRPELNGQDLSDYSDPAASGCSSSSPGVVRAEGAGYSSTSGNGRTTSSGSCRSSPMSRASSPGAGSSGPASTSRTSASRWRTSPGA